MNATYLESVLSTVPARFWKNPTGLGAEGPGLCRLLLGMENLEWGNSRCFLGHWRCSLEQDCGTVPPHYGWPTDLGLDSYDPNKPFCCVSLLSPSILLHSCLTKSPNGPHLDQLRTHRRQKVVLLERNHQKILGVVKLLDISVISNIIKKKHWRETP